VKLLSWIVMVPFAAAVVAFAVANRGGVELDLWPLPYRLESPVFAVVLASALAGFVAGGIVAWISGGRSRRRARQKAREAEEAAREAARLRARIAELESAGSRPAAVGGRPGLPAAVDAA
jgi:uncharacterized integral membrane protein